MEVRMFSRYILVSSLSDIHLHTSIITCLGFVFISCASSFYRFLREGREMAVIILGEGNLESNNSLCLMSRWVLGGGGVMYVCVFLLFSWGVGDIGATSGGGRGCIGQGGIFGFFAV